MNWFIQIRCWWWRIWTFRNAKFKMDTSPPNYFMPGETLTYGKENRYAMYIGKGYYINCHYGKIKYPY